eukprot:gene45138-60270_t
MSSHLPVKQIFSSGDLDKFKGSSTFNEILEFVKACGDSIIGTPISAEESISCPTVRKIELFMTRLSALVDEIPPLEQPMRFGNKAFRLWYARVGQEIPAFVSDLLGDTGSGTAAID